MRVSVCAYLTLTGYVQRMCAEMRIIVKKIEVIIMPESLEILREVLEQKDIKNFDIVSIMDYDNDNTTIKKYRGAQYRVNMISKIKAEIIAADDVVFGLTEKIAKKINLKDSHGRILVYDISLKRTSDI